MRVRESDPLVMLTGAILTALGVVVFAAGFALGHFWR
jgi:hypothetical protein